MNLHEMNQDSDCQQPSRRSFLTRILFWLSAGSRRSPVVVAGVLGLLDELGTGPGLVWRRGPPGVSLVRLPLRLGWPRPLEVAALPGVVDRLAESLELELSSWHLVGILDLLLFFILAACCLLLECLLYDEKSALWGGGGAQSVHQLVQDCRFSWTC